MPRERHPLETAPAGKSAEERLRILEEHLAMLWDQVWWLSLPVERRDAYRAEGYSDPVQKFYIDVPDDA
jgi:hypothetical protein